MAGVKVRFVDYQGPARLSVSATERHRLNINVDPRSERESLNLGVELPISGRDAWPIADVEVLNSNGRAMSVRHDGIEWHKLVITVPAKRGTYVVHFVDPPSGRSRPLPEEGRYVTDPETGVSATISKWFQGRRAALSIRFDDSHPTHLSRAIPILREYGFRGTFMVNPGDHPPNSRRRSAFHEHRSRWAAVAQAGDQEFANHTLHHRGAQDDADMEYQVGGASNAIWAMFPGKSRLLALNLGGGTKWETTRTLRYYLDKYHLFDASSGSLGMDDVYGDRVSAFAQHLRRHLERQGWCRVHFHYIGEGLSSSEENFRAILDIAKEHETEIWIAGMADIYKYQVERNQAELAIASEAPLRAVLTLTCSTDPELYDQDLTIQIALPSNWPPEKVTVQSEESGAVIPTAADSSGKTIRFDAPPITAAYIIERRIMHHPSTCGCSTPTGG
jgi:hypothetical protein